jgi:hypothetical protein
MSDHFRFCDYSITILMAELKNGSPIAIQLASTPKNTFPFLLLAGPLRLGNDIFPPAIFCRASR